MRAEKDETMAWNTDYFHDETNDNLDGVCRNGNVNGGKIKEKNENNIKKM